MQIDGNELALLWATLDQDGHKSEALKIRKQFLQQIRDAGDHCPCPESCAHHGNCFECVMLQRAHRDHLPMCLWDMLNERISSLARLTEGSFSAYEERKAQEQAAPCDGCDTCSGCGECGG